MKKIITIVCWLMTMGQQSLAAGFETAATAVKNMGVGWNLGNTLEANIQSVTDVSSANFWGQQGLDSETCWGQKATKPELLRMMREAGFGAIRVPVTWYNHMDKDGNVDAQWMKRVREVVDYCIDQGLYCIINVHHDTGADSYDNNGKLSGYHWIKADMDNYTDNKARYEYLWTQIAREFKDYDEHLLFESYNEMLDKLSSWCFASFSSKSKYDATIAKSAYDAVNSYAQSFVNAVRATGGNNARRNLVVNTYGSCCGSGTWNNHLKDPLTQLSLPTDPATGHLIVQVHAYPNIESGIDSAKKEFFQMVATWQTTFLSKGIPMLLGEWGTSNVDKGPGNTDYDLRRNVMLQFADYVVSTCKRNGVATFYWMGLSDGAARSIPAFNQADLAETIVKACHGSGYKGSWPSMGDVEMEYTINYSSQWGEASLFSGSATLSAYKGVRVELGEAYPSGTLNIKVYGEADGKEQVASIPANTRSYTLTFSPAKLGSKLSRVTLQGRTADLTVKLSKAVLIKSNGTEDTVVPGVFWGCTVSEEAKTSGIGSVRQDTPIASGPVYDLRGQRVSAPRKGISIRGGRKYLGK